MPLGLLGRKIGMTQVYDGEDIVPVTVIEAGPCVVLQLKDKDRDGYEAVQLGFDDKPRRKASRAERGHITKLSSKRQKKLADRQDELEKAGVPEEHRPKAPPAKSGSEPKRFIREFRTDGESHDLEVGQSVTLGIFAEQKFVDIVGNSKGRGFAGQMKRHNFHGQRASHGVKRVHRHGGSIGMSADPARVLKGTRMAGRYGNTRITVQSLKVVRVDEENNMLLVKGAIPGPNGGYVMISPSIKK